MHLDRVAPHAELAAAERRVVAVVLQVDEFAQQPPLVVTHASVQLEKLAAVLLGIAHAVDAADAGHHDGVAPCKERRGRRVAEAVDVVVDRAVLFDVGVARREVRLGLVVVVVADEVLDPVVREELAELVGELRGEALVRGQHQGGPLDLLDGPRDRGALARTGDAEEGLEALPAFDAFGERGDGLGLVAGRLEIGYDLEGRHPQDPIRPNACSY